HRFIIFVGHPGVANMGVSERDDLLFIAGVCHNLLVACDRGIEDNFANGVTFSAKSIATKNRAIGEGQNRRRGLGKERLQQGRSPDRLLLPSLSAATCQWIRSLTYCQLTCATHVWDGRY